MLSEVHEEQFQLERDNSTRNMELICSYISFSNQKIVNTEKYNCFTRLWITI